jgi:putative hemolysin
MPVDPFSFDPPSSPPGRAIANVARSLLFRLAALEQLRTAYASLPPGTDDTFPKRVLTALGIETAFNSAEIDLIPRQGPLVIAANHPRGALDGLVLAALAQQVRTDVRLVANRVLSRIPELRSTCFFVDPFETPGAASRNLAGLRAAHRWLRNGGALILFPAGEVTHQRHPGGILVERPWPDTLGRLVSESGATVIPAFIDGGNSKWFYAAGRMHPLLRTVLLPRELLRARGTRVTVRIGAAVGPLVGRGSRSSPGIPEADSIEVRTQRAVVSLATMPATPSSEVLMLPPNARLVASGRFDVFHAEARSIPVTLQEIGRLRAVTFQAAGEGTGAAVDLDGFDGHYVHLFVWDRDAQCVVGAYRLGRTDCIVRERGLSGLYTRTLFDYGPALMHALSPALELGRSFVRAEYQREYQPLLLLWRGIGQFVVRHPEYRWLFGPVSISARYAEASRATMSAFLELHHRDPALSPLVQPLHPRALAAAPVLAATGDVDQRVAALEDDGKGMPVLLRQYLKLGAKVLGISEDPAFGDVTDVLMAVDLSAARPSILRRYFGDEGLALYLARHSKSGLSPAA